MGPGRELVSRGVSIGCTGKHKSAEQGQDEEFEESLQSDSSAQTHVPIFYLFIYLSFFSISGATLTAYGGSQARGPIGAIATGLRQSHTNVASKPRLRPTPQLTATPDP